MKKLLLTLTFFLFLSTQAFCAWTITGTNYRTYQLGDGSKIVLIRLSLTSDANASGAFNLSTYLTGAQLNDVKGGYLYYIESVPGTGDAAPSGTFSLSIKNSLGSTILTHAGLSETAAQIVPGFTTLGIFPTIHDGLTFAIGTLGDANTATLYVAIAK